MPVPSQAGRPKPSLPSRHLTPMRALVFLLFATACPPKGQQPRVADTPEAAYLAFVGAIRAQDPNRAYGALSLASRQEIDTRVWAIADASAGLVRADPATVLFQSGSKLTPEGEVKVRVQTSSPDKTTLAIEGASGEVVVTMIRESDRWVVDLTEALLNSGK
jgi:hypothetical protein